MNKRELLEHHIYFLSKHRGRRESLSDIEIIHSDKSAFNIVFPLSKKKLINIKSTFCIYLPDWIEVKRNADLSREKKGSLTYMLLSNQPAQWQMNEQLRIKRAATLAEIEDFSLVQGRGFCETQDVFDEWYPWMREKNIVNFADKNQYFYLAYQNEKPIGVSLAIVKNNLLGIYAVTTLPEFRKQGFSTTLMKYIVETHQTSLVTLQVETNSDAHFFYRQLGFTDIFECSIFV